MQPLSHTVTGKKDYALGVERMFFRLGCAAFLEELSEADPVAMAPVLNAKLALFEKKKVARDVIEKDLRMWACRRRHAVLVLERRKKEEEERRKEEDRRRREEDQRKRKEEEEARRAAADARRQDEEAKRCADMEAKTTWSKCASWQCPSTPPVPPQGTPHGGSGRLGTPRGRAQAHGAPSHRLSCSSEPPPKSPISLPLTVQAPSAGLAAQYEARCNRM